MTQAERGVVRIALANGSQRQLANDDVTWAAAGARGKPARALRRGAAIYVHCPREGRCGLPDLLPIVVDQMFPLE